MAAKYTKKKIYKYYSPWTSLWSLTPLAHLWMYKLAYIHAVIDSTVSSQDPWSGANISSATQLHTSEDQSTQGANKPGYDGVSVTCHKPTCCGIDSN